MSQIKKIVVLASAIPVAVIGLALAHRTTVVAQTPERKAAVSIRRDDARDVVQHADGKKQSPARHEKTKSVDLAAEPIEPYLLTKNAGPFMVLARVFRGPDAKPLAIALARELRNDYGLHAYILRKGDMPADHVRGVPPAGVAQGMGPDGGLPEKRRTIDQAAVLVGDEKSLEDQVRLWREVKKIQPKCLEQPVAGFQWRKSLFSAVRTVNPLIPARNLPIRHTDNLVKRLNLGPPWLDANEMNAKIGD
jgi:hypothetical protein